jgi:ATP-dependent DNA ligase
MKPMFTSPYTPSKVAYPCYIQPKLNGIRALYQIGHFQSPHDANLTHLSKPLSKIFDASTILDGALYVHGWPLQRIKDALTNNGNAADLEFHVFDVVNFRRPFGSRFMAPASILTDTQHLHKTKVVETHRVTEDDTVDYFFNKWMNAGYDGMIYRLNHSPYTPGKNRALLHRNK